MVRVQSIELIEFDVIVERFFCSLERLKATRTVIFSYEVALSAFLPKKYPHICI